MTDLGTLGGTLGHPSGINDRGQVCGDSNLAGDLIQHVFLWDHEKMKDLGTLGGSNSFVRELSENGEVVGSAELAGDQAFHAFLWKHGRMSDLGTVDGDGCSSAASINSRGQVVGQSFACDGSVQHAFLWKHGGPAIDLNTVPPGSGLTLTDATRIADGGEITGQAVLDNGEEHAYLLIPREKDDDDDTADNATAATQNEAAPAVRSPARVTHGRPTPETLPALRVRLAHRNRGLGSRLPEQAN